MSDLMALGRTWGGAPLFASRKEDDVVAGLRSALERNARTIKQTQSALEGQVQFRGEVRRRVTDPANPRDAGWCFLYNPADPLAGPMLEIIRPLAEHRGMIADIPPMQFHGEPPEDWFGWLTEHYEGRRVDGLPVPGFILILGGPAQVPFAFQALLQTVASVGRVVPDSADDLNAYVDKLLRIERADGPTVDREIVFFGTDDGMKDPTYFSREYMVKPLMGHVRDILGYPVTPVLGAAATREGLEKAIAGKRPALVYTASHGLGAVDATLDIQKRFNGAICCHSAGPQTIDTLWSAEQVPTDRPFLEGAVFFQFACFGYGTPAVSDYAHWLDGYPQANSTEDLVSALPKKLIAHPHGPIAYIGHVDTAFLHGFTDETNPHIDDRWHRRIAPFLRAIEGLLAKVEPSGLAMESMSDRYSATSALLTSMYDKLQRKESFTPERQRRLLDHWIIRGDAQNFMVMGDPAALLRIPSP